MRSDLNYSWYITIFYWSITIVNLMCSYAARIGRVKSVYLLILLLEVRLIFSYCIVNEILDQPNPHAKAVFAIIGYTASFMNTVVLGVVFKK